MKTLTKITAALLMVAGLILSGCGTSDKFAGSWYVYDATNRRIIEMRIEKTPKEGKYTAQEFFHKYIHTDKLVEKKPIQDTVDLIYIWKPSNNEKNNLTMNDAGELEYDGWEGLAKIKVKDNKMYLVNISHDVYEKWTKDEFEKHRDKIREQLKKYRPSGYDIFGTFKPQPIIKRVRNIIIDPPTIK